MVVIVIMNFPLRDSVASFYWWMGLGMPDFRCHAFGFCQFIHFHFLFLFRLYTNQVYSLNGTKMKMKVNCLIVTLKHIHQHQTQHILLRRRRGDQARVLKSSESAVPVCPRGGLEMMALGPHDLQTSHSSPDHDHIFFCFLEFGHFECSPQVNHPTSTRPGKPSL